MRDRFEASNNEFGNRHIFRLVEVIFSYSVPIECYYMRRVKKQTFRWGMCISCFCTQAWKSPFDAVIAQLPDSSSSSHLCW